MVAVITRSSAARTSGAFRPNLVLIRGGQESAPLRLLPPLDHPAPPLHHPAPGAPMDLQPFAPAGFRIVSPPKRSVLRYWRVLAVLMVALAVVAGGWLVVRAIGGLGGGGSLTSSGEPAAVTQAGGTGAPAGGATSGGATSGGATSGGATSGGATSGGATYSAARRSDVHPTQGRPWVVRPGDTLWGIVEASGVQGDPRPVVDKLAAELKGQPLQVGQSVTVP